MYALFVHVCKNEVGNCDWDMSSRCEPVADMQLAKNAVAERFGCIKDAKLDKNKYWTVFELSCGT